MSLAIMAMNYARLAHSDQKRKYTGAPYTDHLAEVAGIVATLPSFYYLPLATHEERVAVAWLHDVIEDQGVKHSDLVGVFGPIVAGGVLLLSDLETEGNRAARKAASRARLAEAPDWVQTIKVADLISNTGSIVQHDPVFAVTYLEEKRLLLDVLTGAHPALLAIAREMV